MFGWYDENKTRMGLAYLFLSSENRISDADYALFEEIGKSMEGFADWKGEIVGDCEKMLASANSATARSEIVSEFFSTYQEIGKSMEGFPDCKKEVVEKYENLHTAGKIVASSISMMLGASSPHRGFFLGGELSEKSRRNILFTLASLADVSEKKSEARQKLIELWAEVNSIDKSVLMEMQDMLESERAIDGYRNWLKASGMTYGQVEPVMAELDKNIKELRDGANALIALG